MRFVAYGSTDIGNVRSKNEDRFLVDLALRLAVVCDGVGGSRSGEMAATTCVDVVHSMVAADLERLRECYRNRELEEVQQTLVRIVDAANAEVHRLSKTREAYHKMATTLTMLLGVGRHVFVAHVGDSRLYLLRENKLYQLTVDHTYVNQLAQAGVDLNTENIDPRLGNMLVRAIGQEHHLAADVQMLIAYPGDRYLLCSDGLHRYIDKERGLEELVAEQELDQVPRNLCTRANHCGGADNVTAIVVAFEREPADDPLLRALQPTDRRRSDRPGRHISSWF
ncbi:MAG: serine/threonine-protein phosphatase [Myxococcales bacterium]|nr:serine/threonine-protein phosphatase [Myxococcales bacterium]